MAGVRVGGSGTYVASRSLTSRSRRSEFSEEEMARGPADKPQRVSARSHCACPKLCFPSVEPGPRASRFTLNVTADRHLAKQDSAVALLPVMMPRDAACASDLGGG